MKISITRQFGFEACHFLPYYMGKCHNLHGHSYILEVTVSGDVILDKNNPKCGMIIDFNDLDALVNNEILRFVDHHYLNDIFDCPTAEVMVAHFAASIIKALPEEHFTVEKVKLWETKNNSAEITDLKLADFEQVARVKDLVRR